MRIALFGATGGTGQQIIRLALEAGHEIRALVRDPAKLKTQSEQLTMIQGDVLSQDKVAETLLGTDAVICSLGNTANNPEKIVSRGTELIIQTMQMGTRPRRIIVITSLGVGDSQNQVPFAFRLLAKTILRSAMQDKEEQEQVVKTSGLEWIIVRPGGLTDKPATGQYRFGLDREIIAGQVSRADVAAFVLRQLTDDTFLYQTPAIS
ncbi:MAG: SDR family oxidoreductase [Anaerolineae bacterium]|nr:SDR family oxidoreductase [Anaerolineae bacterium]